MKLLSLALSGWGAEGVESRRPSRDRTTYAFLVSELRKLNRGLRGSYNQVDWRMLQCSGSLVAVERYDGDQVRNSSLRNRLLC